MGRELTHVHAMAFFEHRFQRHNRSLCRLAAFAFFIRAMDCVSLNATGIKVGIGELHKIGAAAGFLSGFLKFSFSPSRGK